MTTQIKGNDTSTFGGNIDVTGNVVTDAPAFSAYANAGASISAGTWTKVPMNVERFDTNNCYDTTNYRFTPNVAGYYQFNGAMGTVSGGSAGYFLVGLYKNGSTYAYGSNYPAHSANGPNSVISSLIYMNGSTDYVELYIVSAVSATTYSDSVRYFDGHLVRAV